MRGKVMQKQRYARLREPIMIGDCVVRNRIVRTAHATGYSVDGKFTNREIDYQVARARNGVGLIILGCEPVHRSTARGVPSHHVMLFNDQFIDGHARLAEAVHRHDTKIFQQIWHGGPQAFQEDGGFPWGPSDVISPVFGAPVIPMTQDMIDDVIAGFASAARRCKEAGLDGVEIHAAHGYLHGQFLSQGTNRRTDGYGGSLYNRTLFTRQCLAAIRAEVGPGFAVGVRLSGSEGYEDGIQPQECAETAMILEKEGLVDFIDVSIGGYFALDLAIGPMYRPLCYELPTSRPVTEAVKVPTIVTGRIMNLHDAERIVAEGIADMVSMVRAMIADPELVSKSFDGREKDVRPCISCNQGCVGGAANPAINRVICTVNPGVGFEGVEQFPRTEKSRRILVVGGGAAGLEAAYTAARRGHKVVLAEAGKALGGTITLARRAPGREDIGTIADYLAEQINELGVDVRLNTFVDEEAIRAIAPDAVIVATGGEPRRSGRQRWRPGIRVSGIGLSHVVTPVEVLGGMVRNAKSALIFDDIGHASGVSVAAYLLERGCGVTFATNFQSVAAELWATGQREGLQGRLRKYDNFREFTRSSLIEVTATSARLRDLDSGKETIVAADVVVLETGVDPRQELYGELVKMGVEAHLAGDAAIPGDLLKAIASGRHAGQLV